MHFHSGVTMVVPAGMAGVGCSPALRQDPARAVALSPSEAGCKVAEPRPDYPGLAALSSPRPLLFIVRRAVRLRCAAATGSPISVQAAWSPARLPLRKKRRLFLGKALKSGREEQGTCTLIPAVHYHPCPSSAHPDLRQHHRSCPKKVWISFFKYCLKPSFSKLLFTFSGTHWNAA